MLKMGLCSIVDSPEKTDAKSDYLIWFFTPPEPIDHLLVRNGTVIFNCCPVPVPNVPLKTDADRNFFATPEHLKGMTDGCLRVEQRREKERIEEKEKGRRKRGDSEEEI